jgi:hypothetical protein
MKNEVKKAKKPLFNITVPYRLKKVALLLMLPGVFAASCKKETPKPTLQKKNVTIEVPMLNLLNENLYKVEAQIVEAYYDELTDTVRLKLMGDWNGVDASYAGMFTYNLKGLKEDSPNPSKTVGGGEANPDVIFKRDSLDLANMLVRVNSGRVIE